MKTTKDKLKQLISEELTNIISEQGRSGMAGMERDDDAFAQMLAKQAGVSSKAPEKEVDDKDEAKKAADEIRELAEDLEKELDGELKEKATAIIDLVNTRL